MVQCLSSDIYIFQPVLFLRVRIPEFFFIFFYFSYSFSGQFELPSAVKTVLDPEGVQGVSEQIISFL